MSKTQILLAILLVLTVVGLFLPWVTAEVTVGSDYVLATNQGYEYIVPGDAPYAAPMAILCIIGLILAAYSFKAQDKIRKLNIIGGILILLGPIAAFAYTSGAGISEMSHAGGSVYISGAYGMGLEVLFGILVIIVGARAKPKTA